MTTQTQTDRPWRRRSRRFEQLEVRRLLAIDSASIAEQVAASQPKSIDPLPPLAVEGATAVHQIAANTVAMPAAPSTSLTSSVAPGSWTLVNTPLPNFDGAQLMLQLPDGSIMVHGGSGGASPAWYKLTPDSTGSYIAGTWSTLAPMNVGRLYFASDVLPDNRVFVAGGEYTNISQSESNLGEIYNSLTNTWTNIPNFPQNQMGDATSIVLPDGRILAGYISGPQTYIYDPVSNSWSQTGTKLRSDISSEETWVKLPDGSILSYDIWASINTGQPRAQRYIPATGQWVDAGALPEQLSSSTNGFELGPGLLLPDGRVFLTGANGNTAYYDPASNTWTAGPVIPNGLAQGDAPAAMLPNGDVLMAVSPPVIGSQYPGPTYIYEFNPLTNTYTDVTPTNIGFVGHSFATTMLVLPTGQVALCADSGAIDIYTPVGSPDPSWAPTITNIAYDGANTFTLTGTQLTGISQGASYGDDAQMDSNYPIVRLTNYVTGAVSYARSFNWSSTGVATGNTPVTVQFELPPGATDGTYLVQVVANGIASNNVGIGMFVLSQSPAPGDVVATPPTDFEIDFSSPFDPATLAATDLTVNGVPADSFIALDAQRVKFHFNSSPVAAKGLQTMAMAAGVVQQMGTGTALQAFSSTFRYDPNPLTITSIDPADGSNVPLPFSNLVVHFSEPYDPASLAAADLELSQGQVTAVTPIDSETASFTLSGITQEGPLNVQFTAGAFTDSAGDPSVPFNGSLNLDIGTEPYPVPLTAVAPQGSQVYDPAVAGYISTGSDTDSFTISATAGQTLSVVVQPGSTLQAQILLLAPGGAILENVTAPLGAGHAIVLNSVPVTASGTYTVVVGSFDGSTGPYTTQIVVNASLEVAQYGDASDNNRASAQSIDGTFIDLGGGVSRAAVLGQSEKPQGTLPNEIEPNNTLGTANDASSNFIASSAPLYQIAIKGNLETPADNDWINLGTLHQGDRLTISESGQPSSRGTVPDTYVELYRGDSANPTFVTFNDDGGPGFDSFIYSLQITTTDTYYIKAHSYSNLYSGTYDLAAWLQPASIAPATGSIVTSESEGNDSAATATDASHAWRLVQYVSLTSGTAAADADFYKYHFNAGDIVSALAHSLQGSSHVVTILDSSGHVLANEDGESSTGADANSPIYGYLISTTGDYYIEVQTTSGTTDNYQLQVYLSAATPPPPPISGDDYYSFFLAAGESVSLALNGLSGSDVTVDLEDAGGNILAAGQPIGTNVTVTTAPWVAAVGATYYAHVTSSDTDDYNLVVTHNATFDTEPNNDSSSGASLDGTRGALGYLDSNLPSLDGQFPFTIDSNLSSVTLGAHLGGDPGLDVQEQAPGSLTSHLAGQLFVDHEENSVAFTGGSSINAIAQPGLFLPGNQTADFAGQFMPAPSLIWPALLQDIVVDLRSGALNTAPIGSTPTEQSFDTNSLILSLTSGTIAYDVTGITSGMQSVAGLSQVNQSAIAGTITETPDHLHLIIPIHFSATISVPVLNIPATLSLDGQIVADYQSPGPIDPVDYYSVNLTAGQSVNVSTTTPGDSAVDIPTNTLDPALVLVDPSGNVIGTDDNGELDGKNAYIALTAPVTGLYHIGVYAMSGVGEYVLHVEPAGIPPVASAGGPYVVSGYGSVALDASGSSDPNAGGTLTYSWDVNGDGIYGDATGATPTLSWSQLQALGVTAAGDHTIHVRVNDGILSSTASAILTVQYSAIAGRHIFYNNSSFDGNNPAANAADDAAIAPDKTALLPGQTATFSNYTSYSRGINGIMVDVAGLPHALNSSDLQFFVGNLGNVPTDWVPGPSAASIATRPGAGDNASDRVTITWTDNAIQKQWLLVRVIANADTGLAQDDFFYFGNAIGDTGNSSSDAGVNATDENLARANQQAFVINPASLTNPYDFNRDQSVNATDQIIARRNQTALDALQLITTPNFDATEQAIALLDAPVGSTGLVAGIAGPAVGLRGQPQTFTLSAQDALSANPSAIYSYTVDWGDGSPQQTFLGPASLTVTHTFGSLDFAKVHVIASDSSGNSSPAAQTAITLTDLQFVPDQQDPTLVDLVWGGTSGDDQVRFDQVDATTIRVTEMSLARQPVNEVQTYSVTGRVIALGGGGNDQLDARGLLTTSATLDGGAGNNTLYGGSAGDTLIGGSNGGEGQQGSNVIVAGNGNNLIYGNAVTGAEGAIGGNNLIIGGAGDDIIYGNFGTVPHGGARGGRNLIVGGAGSDTIYASQQIDGAEGGQGSILIADTTTLSQSALSAVLAEWTSNDSLQTRLNDIRGNSLGGANGTNFLEPGGNVIDDESNDLIYGDTNGAFNWLIYSFEDDTALRTKNGDSPQNVEG